MTEHTCICCSLSPACYPPHSLPPPQLKFEEDLAITRMYSGEGEDVPLRETLYPTGNVEDWLLEVERVMRASLKAIIQEALEDYPQVSRKESLPCVWSSVLQYAHVHCMFIHTYMHARTWLGNEICRL